MIFSLASEDGGGGGTDEARGTQRPTRLLCVEVSKTAMIILQRPGLCHLCASFVLEVVSPKGPQFLWLGGSVARE